MCGFNCISTLNFQKYTFMELKGKQSQSSDNCASMISSEVFWAVLRTGLSKNALLNNKKSHSGFGFSQETQLYPQYWFRHLCMILIKHKTERVACRFYFLTANTESKLVSYAIEDSSIYFYLIPSRLAFMDDVFCPCVTTENTGFYLTLILLGSWYKGNGNIWERWEKWWLEGVMKEGFTVANGVEKVAEEQLHINCCTWELKAAQRKEQVADLF